MSWAIINCLFVSCWLTSFWVNMFFQSWKCYLHKVLEFAGLWAIVVTVERSIEEVICHVRVCHYKGGKRVIKVKGHPTSSQEYIETNSKWYVVTCKGSKISQFEIPIHVSTVYGDYNFQKLISFLIFVWFHSNSHQSAALFSDFY